MIESFKLLLKAINYKDRRNLLLLFICMFIGTLLELAGVGIIPVFIGILADPEKMKEIPVINKFLLWSGLSNSSNFFVIGGLLVMGMFVIKNTFIIWLLRYKVLVIQSIQFNFEKRLFNAYLNMSYLNHVKSNSAQLLRNLTTEINIVIVNFLFPLMVVFMDSLLAIFILSLLLWSNFLATIIIISFLGLLGGAFFIITNKSIKFYGVQELQNRMDKIKTINQSLNGIKEIKVLNNEDYFFDEFVKYAWQAIIASRYMRIMRAIPKPIIETLAVIALLGISIFLFSTGSDFNKILPTIALFTVAFVKLMPSFRSLVESFTSIRYYKSSIGVIAEDLSKYEANNKKLDNINNIKSFQFEKSLTIKDLIFKYPGNKKNVLDKLNIEIRKGNVIGIVGSTGSGKTTLIDIILGLLKPLSGNILVDDLTIDKNLPSWQKTIGYIPQTIHLNDDTIKKNIAFGVQSELINDDLINEVVSTAQLSTLIQRLPHGLDTVIGERGIKLSGGERQRIGIARALYNKPKILIMDEATSSLDNLTEKYIVDSINSLRGRLTIIVIAHRLQTITNCDKIYFIKDGKVTDSGTYAELAKNNYDFRKMGLINDKK